MAADQQWQQFSAPHKTSAPPSKTSITDENTVIVMPQAADPTAAGLAYDAGAAAGNNSFQSNMGRVQAAIGARAHNLLFHGSASETVRELHLPPINPSTSDGDLSRSSHLCPRIDDGCCSSNRTVDCTAPLQERVTAVDNERGSMTLQSGDGEHTSPIMITWAFESSKKLHARRIKGSTAKVDAEVDEKDFEEAGELDQGEEEEGCVTPTARDQQIPQYDTKLNAVCPPAPKKKPCASKRRRLFYSANTDAGASSADNFVAERRAFLVDPPDLHSFPDCIRALFK